MPSNQELLILIQDLQSQVKSLQLEVQSLKEPKCALNKFDYTKNTLKEKMQEHGLLEQGWNFGFNKRAKSAGVTKYHTKMIELSMIYIESESVTEQKILNTILHEIAHALVGHSHGHNEIWKKKAKEIGCNAERCCDTFTTEKDYKYLIKCSKGCVIKRHRLTGKWKTGGYVCKKHKEKLTICQQK